MKDTWDWVTGANVFWRADTIMGPAYVEYGLSSLGQGTVYTSIGPGFLSRSRSLSAGLYPARCASRQINCSLARSGVTPPACSADTVCSSFTKVIVPVLRGNP